MGSTGGRANFKSRTRDLLARRAAFRCSNPHCGALTIGPGPGPEDVADTGTAAHIYAAAQGGPRGTGGLSNVERSAISNGIWLCAACGRLVDTNVGNAYSAPLLRSWRDLHEYRTRLEQGGRVRPIGWVQSIEIHNHFLIQSGVMQLSRCNLLLGNNGTGKTHLLQLLRAMANPQPLMDGSKELSCTISWFDPELRTANIGVAKSVLRYEVDGKSVPLAPRPYRVLDVHPHPFPPRSGGQRVSAIAKFLGVDDWTASAVISSMCELMPEVFAHISVEGGEVQVRYRGTLEGQDESEINRILFPFRALATFAELQARNEPTILVLDEPFDHLWHGAVQEIMALFDSPVWSFQNIIATHSPVAFGWSQRGWTATLLMPEKTPGPLGDLRICPQESRISQDPSDMDALRAEYRRSMEMTRALFEKTQARVAPR